MNLPIRVRLTAWYVLLLAVILVALSAFVVVRLKADLVGSIDQTLDGRAAQIALGLRGTAEGEFQDVSGALLAGLPRGESAAQLLTRGGTVVESSGDSVARAQMIPASGLRRALDQGQVRLTAALGADHEPFRVLAVRVPGERDRGVIVVTTSLEEVNGSVHRLIVLLMVAGPVVLAAAGTGGWLLARRALLPVSRMTREASAIGADRPSERVVVPDTRDEVQRLATTLNAMLGRLEKGMQEQCRFVDDASHELRTPLAVMRSEIDVSLRSPGLSDDAQEVLESSREEVERMGRIVENLLTLARIDEAAAPAVREAVELEDVATEVATSMRRLAGAKRITIDVDGNGDGARILGDRGRLEEALTNLVDNAVKYSQEGGEVRLEVWREGPRAGITVSDRGRGIPSGALAHVFDRFFRVDSSRSRTKGGSGLGLAISKAMVEAHGGSLSVSSEVGIGTTFVMSLPAG